MKRSFYSAMNDSYLFPMIIRDIPKQLTAPKRTHCHHKTGSPDLFRSGNEFRLVEFFGSMSCETPTRSA